jgi:hypothetical protein
LRSSRSMRPAWRLDRPRPKPPSASFCSRMASWTVVGARVSSRPGAAAEAAGTGVTGVVAGSGGADFGAPALPGRQKRHASAAMGAGWDSRLRRRGRFEELQRRRRRRPQQDRHHVRHSGRRAGRCWMNMRTAPAYACQKSYFAVMACLMAHAALVFLLRVEQGAAGAGRQLLHLRAAAQALDAGRACSWPGSCSYAVGAHVDRAGALVQLGQLARRWSAVCSARAFCSVGYRLFHRRAHLRERQLGLGPGWCPATRLDLPDPDAPRSPPAPRPGRCPTCRAPARLHQGGAPG